MSLLQSGPPLGKWSTPCTGCFDDMGVCLVTCLCSPAAHGIVMDKLNGGGCVGPCCLYFLGMMCLDLHCCVCGPKRRRGVREKYGLPEDPCDGTQLSRVPLKVLVHCAQVGEQAGLVGS